MSPASVTIDELARETGIPRATIRYHCRDPRGALYGVARHSGRVWLIPKAAAKRFAEQYTRYGSLRKNTSGRNTPHSDRPRPTKPLPGRNRRSEH